MKILKDPSLQLHHSSVMNSVMFIFKSLGLRCVPFLKKFVPQILHMIRTCNQVSLRQVLIQQVASLSAIVQDHLRPFVPAIFEVVEEFWTTEHLATILNLVEKMAYGDPDDFRKYVPGLVPRFLASIERVQLSTGVNSNEKNFDTADFERLGLILWSVRSLRGTLGEFMHLIIPAILKLIDSLINPTLYFGANSNNKFLKVILTHTVTAIQTISVLLQANEGTPLGVVRNLSVPVSSTQDHHSKSSLPARVAQPLIRMLGNETNMWREVGMVIIETLCICSKQMGRERWILLYHNVARDAILKYEERIILPMEREREKDKAHTERDFRSNIKSLYGIKLYDTVVSELVYGNNCNSSFAGLHPAVLLQRAQMGNIQYQLLRGNVDLSIRSLIDRTTESCIDDIQSPSMSMQTAPTNRHRVNCANLQVAWDVSQRAFTHEDWEEWARRLTVELLRQVRFKSLLTWMKHDFERFV